mgnify:CR=1 FL=1
MMDLETCFLPTHNDGHSCGVAVIAATGIISRDMFSDTGLVKFDELFDFQKTVPVLCKDEWICTLAEDVFRNEPEQKTQLFLDMLKQELYIFFDCVAEYQHIILPKRRENMKPLDLGVYQKWKREITWPPVGKSALMNMEESSLKEHERNQEDEEEDDKWSEEQQEENDEEEEQEEKQDKTTGIVTPEEEEEEKEEELEETKKEEEQEEAKVGS